MAVDIPGAISVVVFYVAILAIGIYYGRKTSKAQDTDTVLIADRKMGYFLAVFTITATNVGGGYLNGSAEVAAWSGIVQCIAPVGYTLAFWLAATLYAPKLRREGYVTMFDPFQLKYGRKIGALLFIPQFFSDLFWSAAILAALGSTISLILDISSTVAIILSALVAITYTVYGGIYSVAYTDVLQLILVCVGLVVALPFVLTSSAVDSSRISSSWLGEIPVGTEAMYFDTLLLTIFGGIPWQALYQRVLACKNTRVSVVSSLAAGFLSFVFCMPAVAIGIAGAATDWNATRYDGPVPIPDDMKSFILPLTLTNVPPKPVAILGMGALAAASMSSSDSCILSTSSVLAKNIYCDIFRPQASAKEIVWVLRACIVVVGILGTLIAIFSTTIYGLFILCSDLMYVVLFPQLTLILWMPQANSYGCVVGFVISFLLRLLSGEPVLGLPPAIKFIGFDEAAQTQMFPFRTLAMLIGSFCIVIFSVLTNYLFLNGIVSEKYDFLKCSRKRTTARRTGENIVKSAVSDVDATDIDLKNFKTKEPLL